ncbi:MAG: Gmad2 immunoglobulin-like domain-containing protein [Patescibacteria group bacterium]
MKTSTLIIILIIGLALLGGMYFFFPPNTSVEGDEITTFEECAAKYPVMESYPEQCRTPDGKHFTRDIGNELEKMNLIRINTPRPGETIESPLTITGEARGYWFFEASFPVVLLNANGQEIATGIAQAQGEWMTEDFVPFSTTLTFTNDTTQKGTFLLKKDNPSGLPENEDRLVVPVIIPVTVSEPVSADGCYVGGCSSEVCSEDPGAVSPCMYRPEYGCYQNAVCERQSTGACGWTQTNELVQCLAVM